MHRGVMLKVGATEKCKCKMQSNWNVCMVVVSLGSCTRRPYTYVVGLICFNYYSELSTYYFLRKNTKLSAH